MRPGWPLPRVLAHRCGGTLAPENTLIGLELALAHGVRAVEFDVMLSGSGTPVLIHDETLTRTAGVPGQVADTADEALLSLDAGSWWGPRFAGERIPRFAEAIARCIALGFAVNVEIKPATGYEAATGEAAARMAAALWRGASPLPLLSSFSPAALVAAGAAAPGLPRALLVGAVPADWRDRLTELGAVGLVCDTRRLDAAQAAAIREAGFGLGVYTENDPQRARALLDWGVESVITDRPDLLAHLA